MKKILLAAFLFGVITVSAQEKKSADKGVVYGKVSAEKNAITPDQIQSKLVDNKFEGQVRGKVAQVCTAEGCWIRLQKDDGTTMMVRSKDHAFLMPENIVGKTVLVEGNATVKEVTEQMRRHYAEDAGKSKEEIEKIKGSETTVELSAKGVKVLD